MDPAEPHLHEPDPYGRGRRGQGGPDFDLENTVIVPPGHRRGGPQPDEWEAEPGEELYDPELYDAQLYERDLYERELHERELHERDLRERDGRGRGRYGEDGYDEDGYDEDEPLDEDRQPVREWLTTIAQLVAGGVAGAVLWLAFRWLWRSQALVALVAAVLVTLIAVLLVRRIWRSNDVRTVVMTVLIGLFVTMSPAVLLLDL